MRGSKSTTSKGSTSRALERFGTKVKQATGECGFKEVRKRARDCRASLCSKLGKQREKRSESPKSGPTKTQDNWWSGMKREAVACKSKLESSRKTATHPLASRCHRTSNKDTQSQGDRPLPDPSKAPVSWYSRMKPKRWWGSGTGMTIRGSKRLDSPSKRPDKTDGNKSLASNAADQRANTSPGWRTSNKTSSAPSGGHLRPSDSCLQTSKSSAWQRACGWAKDRFRRSSQPDATQPETKNITTDQSNLDHAESRSSSVNFSRPFSPRPHSSGSKQSVAPREAPNRRTGMLRRWTGAKKSGKKQRRRLQKKVKTPRHQRSLKSSPVSRSVSPAVQRQTPNDTACRTSHSTLSEGRVGECDDDAFETDAMGTGGLTKRRIYENARRLHPEHFSPGGSCAPRKTEFTAAKSQNPLSDNLSWFQWQTDRNVESSTIYHVPTNLSDISETDYESEPELQTARPATLQEARPQFVRAQDEETRQQSLCHPQPRWTQFPGGMSRLEDADKFAVESPRRSTDAKRLW